MKTGILILIVEDDPIIAADLAGHIHDFGWIPMGPARRAEDALELIRRMPPDLVLIDVRLEGKTDGIELAHSINSETDLPLVFLTAHHDRQTLERIKATHPSAYLVKPIQAHNLQTGIELALYNHAHREARSEVVAGMQGSGEYVSEDAFFFRIGNRLQRLKLQDIKAFEAYGNFSFLWWTEGKELLGNPLKSIEQRLSGLGFLRVHRSYVINLRAVEGIQDDECIMHGGMRIPVGGSYREELMRSIPKL